jgi:hypothetical protein
MTSDVENLVLEHFRAIAVRRHPYRMERSTPRRSLLLLSIAAGLLALVALTPSAVAQPTPSVTAPRVDLRGVAALLTSCHRP